ncbi:hypothetical protein HanRHA438_Chr08g0357921 [Helianthus annuus]|uniref:Uncharacterized protein n=1 Tax=Helianthus annuus TaxID=4232 RepID=A0A251U6Q7_HELAN|nr:hypothetical protein HanXRQr2_Chr08g0345651 [Helianthus annuus]KAJ0539387.1 hypothetical protein HanHA300_Chr08g0285711 [Helianthus annuus]KAJ0554081.1 hypothetical protein HanHA89_Chr08g0303671 [Helianthus annuus]KAJ0719687.1 hypothetical protein HanLR1_Chr08g0284521 [Helianthus annuus]KAJ0722915.1 hypothetical protein HanOQP8_Chr08g0292041 [Helianthus annuus]
MVPRMAILVVMFVSLIVKRVGSIDITPLARVHNSRGIITLVSVVFVQPIMVRLTPHTVG